ncbi:hypothetical protein NDU88_006880 [Pleurodeles waltl]|uniref:Uncharacterized protein n=1 Tax=Pleurodeles waltl TaxID=8319 RepID=A0AAV7WC06_PLEWA|nr:hypothetical protein NDU88_006878 [Pleurodeles waltl]KAJ1211521.1 hypothetical protein NDU88_006879 [Pleurodeles waltl]KAJ1211522.1 hypothetical protein NDU88_006880 [Pleurodeles waltl]
MFERYSHANAMNISDRGPSTKGCPVLLFPGRSLALVPVTEESYKRAVLPPLLNGLNSLKSVAETLQTSPDLLQDIPNNVGQLIESSFKSLSEAEQASLSQVRALDANVEERLSKIKKLNDEQKVLEARQQGRKVQLSGLQMQESLARQQQEAAQRAVNNAAVARNRAIQAKRDAEHARKVGIGIMFIPIIGPIIGAIMIAKAHEAMRTAQYAVKEATRSLNTQKNAVNKYVSECWSCSQKISLTTKTIMSNKAQIQDIEGDICRESTLHQKLTHFLRSVRQCTTLLSTLAGRTRTANMLMEFGGMIDALLPVLEEVVVIVRPLIGSSSDYQLLITVRLPTIINKLEEANSRVKQTASSKNGAIQDFI